MPRFPTSPRGILEGLIAFWGKHAAYLRLTVEKAGLRRKMLIQQRVTWDIAEGTAKSSSKIEPLSLWMDERSSPQCCAQPLLGTQHTVHSILMFRGPVFFVLVFL